ncbi:GNAT family N-acetyltransferase [Parvularcula maris]|uniref:GNAT family N-acetyltransferase n=1 Tax=Parvularcula maris TaxID=2965077 RepID=A0A9X2L6L1_9PROT|nr:GNAT family N-acetyltransferase [Parvularcula maris]MCQ8183996.1 GNAT family N-acetyltransferase [Parvularcula maris]
MPHTIRTERLTLRPASLRGARAFWHEVRYWPVLGNTGSWPYPLSYTHTAFMLRTAAASDGRDHVFFMIRGTRPIGSIGLHRDRGRISSLGYMIGEDHWGLGLTSEAVRAVCRFGFRQLRLEAISAVVAEWNEPSKRVLLKNGFQATGRSVSGYSQAQKREVVHNDFLLRPIDVPR